MVAGTWAVTAAVAGAAAYFVLWGLLFTLEMSPRVRLNRFESKYLGHSPLVNAGKGSWTIQPNPRIDEGTGFECLLHLPIDSMSSCSLQELFVFGLGIVTSFPIYTSSILQRSRKASDVLLRRGRCLQESGTWSSGRRSSGICNIWQRLMRGPAGSSKRMGLSAAKETAGNSFTWLNSLKNHNSNKYIGTMVAPTV